MDKISEKLPTAASHSDVTHLYSGIHYITPPLYQLNYVISTDKCVYDACCTTQSFLITLSRELLKINFHPSIKFQLIAERIPQISEYNSTLCCCSILNIN